MKQRGFTLLEVLVVLGIMGLVVPLLAGTIRQLTVQSDRDTTRVTALVGLEDAARFLGRDIPQAQATSLNPGGLALLHVFGTFSLQWTDWADDDQYDVYGEPQAAYKRTRVTYSLVSNNSPCGAAGKPCLQRKVEVCNDYDPSDGSCDSIPPWTTTSTTAAARKITTVTIVRANEPDPSKDRVFSVTITSKPEGSGFPEEKRTFTFYGALLSSEDPVQ